MKLEKKPDSIFDMWFAQDVLPILQAVADAIQPGQTAEETIRQVAEAFRLVVVQAVKP